MTYTELVTVQLLPATDTRGTRYAVTSRRGGRTVHGYDHTASSPTEAAVRAHLATYGVELQEIVQELALPHLTSALALTAIEAAR